jgi:hypothetical protein
MLPWQRSFDAATGRIGIYLAARRRNSGTGSHLLKESGLAAKDSMSWNNDHLRTRSSKRSEEQVRIVDSHSLHSCKHILSRLGNANGLM